jgi:hypothetical protein
MRSKTPVAAALMAVGAAVIIVGSAQGAPPPGAGNGAPSIRIVHTPLPPGIPVPPAPVPGEPGTVTVTFTWSGSSASHAKPGSVTPSDGFGSECSATIETPFNYYGYAFSEAATSCSADVTYIEDSMGLFRNGSIVATNGNYADGSNEQDDVLYGCVNNYHTWQATDSIDAYSSINGWASGGVASNTNYIYC